MPMLFISDLSHEVCLRVITPRGGLHAVCAGAGRLVGQGVAVQSVWWAFACRSGMDGRVQRWGGQAGGVRGFGGRR